MSQAHQDVADAYRRAAAFLDRCANEMDAAGVAQLTAVNEYALKLDKWQRAQREEAAAWEALRMSRSKESPPQVRRGG